MTSSDTDEEAQNNLVRVVRFHKRRRTRTLDYNRYVPRLMKEFLLEDMLFLDQFGLIPYEFEELHTMLESKLLRSHYSYHDSIGTRERLAISLKYLTSGVSILELSKHYAIPYSRIPSMIKEVCKMISKRLMPITMPTPTEAMWLKNAQEFYMRFNIPNCIGTLEGKNLFIGDKKIILLALVDANDKFIMLDIGNYRSNAYRGNVMDESRIGQKFLKKEMHVPPDKPIKVNSEPLPHVILASSHFPDKPYLMRKYSRIECMFNPTHKIFNTRVSRAKVTVNRALMRLRKKWKVFQYPESIPPTAAEAVGQACCCLYNYFDLRSHPEYNDRYQDYSSALTDERLQTLLNYLPRDPRNAREKLKIHFMSPEGRTPWQWQDVLS